MAYYRQWVVWLGVASGAGGMGVFSLVASLLDRNHAFQVFLPSLWVFLLGVSMAGLSFLYESLGIGSRAEHFAEAHDRWEINQAIAKIPEMFSSPRHLADEANCQRNRLIDKSKEAYALAERKWVLHRRWRLARNAAVSISAAAFVFGMGWSIGYITFGGKLVPPASIVSGPTPTAR